ncbi:hypothetical protein TMatcc_001750 [Talaromyces marneffei ATCC 18224]|uniref:Galactose oxidase, putative n=1 Tax=Talaromyces marneffei (strain ATCC 18224 / CBS 334.59 / QM 7333) TaxID=441960 RepID=B6QHP5_TALMQ|nr:uncharacterized protein EYB26_007047 [Talaromyces marneffei]EEA22890.1 galactose oxidase precursor, putative [Talaromyces marneffei ATCC 18224]KAE8551768.1 hypothetical protein EYB25_005658 [Talaromyces marneffei]QGA19358.1 hypothetical protein EYB26_007047 [Talaromyces marneffei]
MLLTSVLKIRQTSRLALIFVCCLIVLIFVFHEYTYHFIALHIPLPKQAQTGSWSPRIPVSLVPAAAAVLPRTGGVLLWAADRGDVFGSEPGNPGRTLTAFYKLATNKVSIYNMTVTDHNMFCPGISLNSVGTLVVTGGSSSEHTSFYSSVHGGSWVEGPQMVIGRGYHGQATLSDGQIFTIGGSWSGGEGNRNGEVLDVAGTTWSSLPGCVVEPMYTNDAKGVFAADNHPWLFAWKNASVFQAGPSTAMNWYGTLGQGAHHSAGRRGSDTDSMNGNAIMYDALHGKILTLGGATSYTDAPASRAAHIITLKEPFGQPVVEKIEPMHYARSFANSAILPSGEVFINGGVTWAKQWTDTNVTSIPELWNPQTKRFTKLAATPIPRSYHSFAILLPDATVLVGGGGLCWEKCEDPSVNHFDVQIFYPPYLYNSWGMLAIRPQILEISNTVVNPESTLTVYTDGPIEEFALLRYGSATHSINTDQRRVLLSISEDLANFDGVKWKYHVTLPDSPGILIPGFWMLFALDREQVPSISVEILIEINV